MLSINCNSIYSLWADYSLLASSNLIEKYEILLISTFNVQGRDLKVIVICSNFL